jgi:hypothetical protein
MATVWKPTTPGLIPLPGHGELVGEDSVTYQQLFGGTYEACLGGYLAKGTMGASGTPDLSSWKVKRCTVQQEKGGGGRLSILWEPTASSSYASLPPDRINGGPVMLKLPLERHPNFAGLQSESGQKAIQRLRKATSEASIAAARTAVAAVTNGADFLAVLDKGIQEFDVPGIQVQITTYSWSAPSLSLGGTASAPTWSGLTFPTGTWKRRGDQWSYSGTYWERVTIYECSITGLFDSTIGT